MKNYYRQFITLLQERPGFALPGKEAAGRIVVEARGEAARATVYIQDISPQNAYKLAFISRHGQETRGIVVGSIIVGERGRYEGRFEFDSRSIGGSGISCEQIEGAVVLAYGENTEDLAAPLSGFKAAPFSWRVNFNFADAKEAEQQQPKVEAAEQHPAVFVEEVPQSVYDFETPDVPFASKEVKVAATPKARPTPDPGHLFEEDVIIDVFDSQTNDTPVKWVAVTLKNMIDLGDKWAKAADCPHVTASFKKYRHILLGQKRTLEGDAYILGVPDVFRSDAAHAGEGVEKLYCNFKLCRAAAPVEGAPGYWLKRM